MNDEESRLSKKRIAQGIVLFAVYIIVLYGLLKYVISNTNMLKRLAEAPREFVIIGLLTTLGNVGLTAALDVTCAKVYGIRLPISDAIVFTFIASAVNLVVPLQMGSIIKAIYYKRKMRLSYSRFLSITAGTIIINLFITFFTLMVSLFVIMVGWHTDILYLVIVSLLLLAGTVVLFLILRMQEKVLMILPFKKYTYPVMAGFFELFKNRRALVFCSINYIICMILGGLRFTTIFECLGVTSGFKVGMLYYGLYTASTVIPILPGNIGISEGIVGIMNMILGAEFDVGLTIVLVNRIYHYIVAIIGALIVAIPAWMMFRKGRADSKNE